MKRRVFFGGVAALTAGGGPLRAVAQTTAPKLRVAMIPIDVGAASAYAYDMGFFAKHGLDVELIVGGTGATVAAAVAGGSIDVGDGNTAAVATAHERGVPFLLVAPSGAWSSKEPTGGLLVAKSGPIQAAKDLNGKTIGVTIVRGISEIAVRAWTDKYGGDSRAMKFVEMPYGEMGNAISAGRIDGANAEEPSLSALLSSGLLRSIGAPNDGIGPNWIEGGFFCTVDFVKNQRDVVRRFADAIAETNAWANGNHEMTSKILEKYSKTPVNPAMKRMFFPSRLRADELQPLIDAAAKYGVLQAPFPARDIIAG